MNNISSNNNTSIFENIVGRRIKVFLNNGTTLTGIVEKTDGEFLQLKNTVNQREAVANKQYIVALTYTP